MGKYGQRHSVCIMRNNHCKIQMLLALGMLASFLKTATAWYILLALTALFYPCVDLQPPSWSPAGESLVIHWCCSIWFSMRPLIFRPRKLLKIWACLFDFFSPKETEILWDSLTSVRVWNTSLNSLNFTFNSAAKQFEYKLSQFTCADQLVVIVWDWMYFWALSPMCFIVNLFKAISLNMDFCL